MSKTHFLSSAQSCPDGPDSARPTERPTEQGDRPRRLSTRDLLLDAAGRVFAERGFAKATSKEICRLAGANSAAVNYYFGGKEKLYEEVLIAAHHQLSNLDELEKIVSADLAPEAKLRAFLEYMVASAMASSDCWGLRVLLREMMQPTPWGEERLLSAALPKNVRLRAIVHEVTGLPLESREVRWGAGFVVSHCIMLMLVPKNIRNTLFVNDDPEEQKCCFEAMYTYILNGLHALKGR